MIYLASKSPRRKQILQELGLDFKVVDSNYEEKPLNLSPIELAKTHAIGKARGAKANGIIIGADTFVVLDEIIEKPKDREDAKRILKKLSGKTHEVITGICIKDGKKELVDIDITKVTFIELTDELIDRYLDVADYMDKSGAYAVQEEASVFIDNIDGSFSNVVGLPKEKLKEMLSKYNKIFK